MCASLSDGREQRDNESAGQQQQSEIHLRFSMGNTDVRESGSEFLSN